MISDERGTEDVLMTDMDSLLSRIEQARGLVGLFRAWDVSPGQLDLLREVLASAERIAKRVAGEVEKPTRRTVGTYGGAVPPDAEERARLRRLLSEPPEVIDEQLRNWRTIR